MICVNLVTHLYSARDDAALWICLQERSPDAHAFFNKVGGRRKSALHPGGLKARLVS